MEKNKIKKEIISIAFMLLASVASAFGFHVFVYSANFAPVGVDGVATMLYELTGFNMGYWVLIFNVPLLVIAWFFLKKRYVIYTVLQTLISSALLIVLAKVDFYQYQAQGDMLISAVFAGIILGARAGIMFKIGASTGGVDIFSCLIQRKKPYFNVESLTSLFCYAIIAVSFFVYKDINCILLSIVQTFIYEKMTSVILADTRNALEVKIVTKNPQEIREEILYNLRHGATLLEGTGMYTETESSVILTVLNRRQIPEIISIAKKYPHTFVYFSDVRGVQGNFRWGKDEEVK